MCGILLHATTRTAGHAQPQLPAWWNDGVKIIADRGPDACSGAVRIEAANGTLDVDLCASVLALRGEAIVPQPICSTDRKLLLLWNGEVFVTKLAGFDLDAHDGEQLISDIERRIDRTTRDPDALGHAFTQTLSAIEGPYAAVLLDVSVGKRTADCPVTHRCATDHIRYDLLRQRSDWKAFATCQKNRRKSDACVCCMP